jgi:hypothetical protein
MPALVVGPYPWPTTPEARETMACARRAARTDEVVVLSTAGSVAPLHGRLSGVRGAANLVRRGRHYDRVIVVATGHGPVHATGRLPRAARVIDALAWGTAFRLLGRVTVVVEEPGRIPGSVGGRTGRYLWTGAAQIEVATGLVRDYFVGAGACPAERIVVREQPPAADESWGDGWEAAIDLESAVALINRRARRAREAARRHR